jgi:hypothetical protein
MEGKLMAAARRTNRIIAEFVEEVTSLFIRREISKFGGCEVLFVTSVEGAVFLSHINPEKSQKSG